MVKRIVTFVLVIYLKSWFQSPLPTSAARNNLEFNLPVLKYREIEPIAAFLTLKSVRRHYWYLTGQMVPLALCDKGLANEEREELAKQIHSMPRSQVKSGRPEFPKLDWSGDELVRPRIASLVTTDSWLIFQLLGLASSQDWLLAPCTVWHLIPSYQKLEEFATNLPVINDLAERVSY